MSTGEQRLLLTPLEAEVVEAALELYLQLQPVPADRRFEYRYRAARSVLEDLQRGSSGFGEPPTEDDDAAVRSDDEMPVRRSVHERVED